MSLSIHSTLLSIKPLLYIMLQNHSIKWLGGLLVPITLLLFDLGIRSTVPQIKQSLSVLLIRNYSNELFFGNYTISLNALQLLYLYSNPYPNPQNSFPQLILTGLKPVYNYVVKDITCSSFSAAFTGSSSTITFPPTSFSASSVSSLTRSFAPVIGGIGDT